MRYSSSENTTIHRDLSLLEELHISFSTKYAINLLQRRSLSSQLSAMHSRTHLHLHSVRTTEKPHCMRWLELTPNLKELNLNYGPNYSDDYRTRPSYSSSYETLIPQIHMTSLRRITNQLFRCASPGVDFILGHMSCLQHSRRFI